MQLRIGAPGQGSIAARPSVLNGIPMQLVHVAPIGAGSRNEEAGPPRGPASPRCRRDYMIPTTCPSGSVNMAMVVSGATSVSGMMTWPPLAATLSSTACGLSVWT